MEMMREKRFVDVPEGSMQSDIEDDEIDYTIRPEFYDSDLDAKDEKWVQQRTRGHKSDAVLSCPGCFTTICMDCQQHEKYLNQFRAMFVLNCQIKSDQILRERERAPKKDKKFLMFNDAPKSGSCGVIFRPVCCSVCSTEVGVYDQDEVFHFFHVLASEPELVSSIHQIKVGTH